MSKHKINESGEETHKAKKSRTDEVEYFISHSHFSLSLFLFLNFFRLFKVVLSKYEHFSSNASQSALKMKK
jgi:hypothetical protein